MEEERKECKQLENIFKERSIRLYDCFIARRSLQVDASEDHKMGTLGTFEVQGRGRGPRDDKSGSKS